jgi:acyl-CoA reductase-like NAD-dependent aldehyde dehydrogenase
VLLRASGWMVDQRDRVIETIVAETGQDLRGRAHRRGSTTRASAFGFWAKNARSSSADERIKTTSPSSRAQARRRQQPLGLIGVIGPWNYPLTNSFGDCIPRSPPATR